MGNSASQFFTGGHGWNYLGRMLGNVGLLVLSSVQTGVSAGLGIVATMGGNPLGLVSVGTSFGKLALQMKSFIQSDGQDINSDLKSVASGIGDTAVNIVNAVSKLASDVSGEVTGATDLGVPMQSAQLPVSNKQASLAPALVNNMYRATLQASGMNKTLNPMSASALGGPQKTFNQTASSSALAVRDAITPAVNHSFLPLSPPMTK